MKRLTPLLLAVCLLAPGCSNDDGATAVVGAAASGALWLGGAAVGAVGTLGSAGLSAAGAAAGAVGSAVAPAAPAAAAATLPEAAASAPAAAPPASVPPAPDPAPALSTIAEVPLEAAGGGSAEPLALLPAGVSSTLAGLRLLDQAGRSAVERVAARQDATGGEVDRCALEVFVAVALGAGHADGARFAVWLTDRARARGEEDALAGLVEVAGGIVEEVRAAAEQAELDAATLVGFDDPERLREAVGVARDSSSRCPSFAARRIGGLLSEEETA